MRQTEQVYKWEIESLERRFKALEGYFERRVEVVEERLNRHDQARLRNWTFLFWAVYAVGIAGLLVTAALS